MALNPVPGSPQELAAFTELQKRLPNLFHRVTQDPRTPHTVLVVPSLSVDQEELAKLSGSYHYEERLLYMLMLLRKPRTRMVFCTSQPIDPVVTDYYLHLLSGIPHSHARERLVLLHTNDSSEVPLSQKILERPRLLRRIRQAVGNPDHAHMACFISSPLERTLAVQIGLPLYANDPALSHLGTKSGCREIFRRTGVLLPDGFENLREPREIAEALAELKCRNPALKKAVVKLNDGFSGEGNAIFDYESTPETTSSAIAANLHRLRFEADGLTWEEYSQKYREMGGVVEAWIAGQDKHSPSAQCRVNAIRRAQVISTHDQVLGGPGGQVFVGCSFPAEPSYRHEIQEAGLSVARELARQGVIGRFSVDFVSIRHEDGWKHFAIEVNLRKGGTTHPFLTLKFLTDGSYDTETGLFYSQTGTPKYYYASDNLKSPRYRGLLPEDLIDISVFHGLHFDSTTERGVVFHLIGALSQYGKLGVVCIGDNPRQASFLYRKTTKVLEQEISLDD